MRKKTSFSADKKRIGNDSNRKRNYRIRTLNDLKYFKTQTKLYKRSL